MVQVHAGAHEGAECCKARRRRGRWSFLCHGASGRGVCQSLAYGLELGPGVGPADLQRRVIGEDVVAEVVERRLRIRCGELRRLLHLLPNRYVDFLTEQTAVT